MIFVFGGGKAFPTTPRAVGRGGESSLVLPSLGPEGGMIFGGGKAFPAMPCAGDRGGQSPELPSLGPDGGMIFRGKALLITPSAIGGGRASATIASSTSATAAAITRGAAPLATVFLLVAMASCA